MSCEYEQSESCGVWIHASCDSSVIQLMKDSAAGIEGEVRVASQL